MLYFLNHARARAQTRHSQVRTIAYGSSRHLALVLLVVASNGSLG